MLSRKTIDFLLFVADKEYNFICETIAKAIERGDDPNTQRMEDLFRRREKAEAARDELRALIRPRDRKVGQ